VNGYIDIDVSNFVHFVNHGRTRRALFQILRSSVVLSRFSTSIVTYRSIFFCVEVISSTLVLRKQINTLRFATIEVENRLKTCSYSSSYFNRVIKLWNSVCLLIDPSSFTSPSSFKLYLKMRYKHILETVFDPDMTCTWSLKRDCGCHK
jgi:hypothetical protein